MTMVNCALPLFYMCFVFSCISVVVCYFSQKGVGEVYLEEEADQRSQTNWHLYEELLHDFWTKKQAVVAYNFGQIADIPGLYDCPGH